MRTTTRLAVVLSTVVLTAASGCTSSSDAPEAGGSTSPVVTPTAAGTEASGTASPTPRSSIDAAAPDVRARPAVAAAIIDTATRADVAPAEVVIAAWSPVTWDDGSTGCPQKGRAYTQTVVEGEVLLLRGGTGLYQYHAAGDGPFAYCANPSSAYSVTADG
jgi:hypothetical protein